jgi:hypothetical protein
MKRKLETNPIGWLEQRTWSGRLLTWGWLAIIISLYSTILTDPSFFQRTSTPQNVMGWMLVLSMAISTAGSFRRERESGVLELLLVSPIGERTIISGRLRGLWNQFLPAFGLLLIVWAYLSSLSLTGGALLFVAVSSFYGRSTRGDGRRFRYSFDRGLHNGGLVVNLCGAGPSFSRYQRYTVVHRSRTSLHCHSLLEAPLPSP